MLVRQLGSVVVEVSVAILARLALVVWESWPVASATMEVTRRHFLPPSSLHVDEKHVVVSRLPYRTPS